MCLSRIDYDANIPQGTIQAWKVFKLYPDGTLRNCYAGATLRGYQIDNNPIPVGEWLEASNGYHARTIHGKRGMSYPAGYHATGYSYAEWLLANRESWKRQNYAKRREEQHYRVTSGYHLAALNGARIWSYPNESPLQVSEQPLPYTYVLRRVELRAVHTIGRQTSKHGRQHRTWVADEMRILPDENTAETYTSVVGLNHAHVR